MIKPYQLEVYVGENGKAPYLSWFQSLSDQKTKAKVEARLARLRAGNMGDCKNVGHGVFELRIDYGPGYRIYFAMVGDKIVLLLLGGDKKRQDNDIKRAQQFLVDFRRIGS